MRHERSAYSRISSSARRARRRGTLAVLAWAILVYVAYWIRYLPNPR
jgi:hypothetical protein